MKTSPNPITAGQSRDHSTKMHSVSERQNFYLSISSAGLLDSLTFQATTRRKPDFGEVEIEVGATGVNFKEAAVEAARRIDAYLVVGPAAKTLVDARGSGRAEEVWPSARNALRLAEVYRSLPPKPVYARAPDARVKTAA